MSPTTKPKKPVWQAEVRWRKHPYRSVEPSPPDETGPTTEGATVEVVRWALRCYVEVFVPGGEPILFLVNHREGRKISFTDPRERLTGTAGTTGIWGTRPGQRPGRARTLTPSAFRQEVARLIGPERADEIIQTVLAPDFF
jgi:hypothetical protein